MNVLLEHKSGDEAALWTAISTFTFDGPDTRRTRPEFTFAARLARENDWATRYTERVIAEYRKFLFLCCVTPTGVTPSDAVDQAWHLHLTYTKSYWHDLCRDTLGRELHHNPTKGGAREGQKFDGMYSDSQALYQLYFGEKPPADIWPTNQQRFSDIDFGRINRRTNWVVAKPAPAQTVGAVVLLGALSAAGIFLQASSSLLFWLLTGFALFFVVIVNLANANDGPNRPRRQGDTSGGDGGFVLFGSDDGHHSGDSGDGGHGDAGCSASGCGSGCSGCGGGCGGGD
ncbi:glycine-rich domain-containing protein [Fibrella aquatilis]|uniref:TIGR04222 domain-containing membrane protein n=1 Tax=Fibrella aquatilis TaxID=2817059 RepID=A0A939JZG7_9BACT|nr:hypothetical protein [Fibrella aquatilis]MBO0933129.1 hypothetical protein [Fibrella aquatilis]